MSFSVHDTKKDIDTRLTKAWTAIDKLSVIWKKGLTDKMKRSFFQAVVGSILLHHLDANKTARKEARRQLHKDVASNIKLVLATTPYKGPTIRPPASHPENYPSKTNQARRTLLKEQRRAHKWCTPMDLHLWPSKNRTTSSNIHTTAMWRCEM